MTDMSGSLHNEYKVLCMYINLNMSTVYLFLVVELDGTRWRSKKIYKEQLHTE